MFYIEGWVPLCDFFAAVEAQMLKRIDFKFDKQGGQCSDDEFDEMFDKEYDDALRITARLVWAAVIRAADSDSLGTLSDKTGFLLAGKKFASVFEDEGRELGLEREDGPFIDLRMGVFGILDEGASPPVRNLIVPAGVGVVILKKDIVERMMQSIRKGLKDEFPDSQTETSEVIAASKAGRPARQSAAVKSFLENAGLDSQENLAAKEVSLKIKETFGIDVSPRTVRRVRAKERAKRPK